MIKSRGRVKDLEYVLLTMHRSRATCIIHARWGIGSLERPALLSGRSCRRVLLWQERLSDEFGRRAVGAEK
jgi:hypothetical protein